MNDHRAQVEELLAEYRRSREQLASVHHALAALTESASSDDGAVRATVGQRGTLTALVIDDSAYRRYRPAELADLIVRTTAAAAAKAARAASEVVAPVLPPGSDPEALLRGTADLAPAELRPVSQQPVEENFEERTWMERGGIGR
jgi:DNA-binding protein YbaB